MTRRIITVANLIGWPLFALDQYVIRRHNRKSHPAH